MANKRISSLGSLGGTPAVGDIIPITDISDTAGSAQGTTKKVTVANLVAAAPQGDLLASNNLSDVASATTSRTNLGLGSAATLNTGTSANNVVQLNGSAQLPAVDGSNLTGISFAFKDITTKTASFTLSNSESGKVINCNSSSRIDITIPAGLTAGFNCRVVQKGLGRVRFLLGGTTTLNSYTSGASEPNAVIGRYGVVDLVNTSTNAYHLSGDYEYLFVYTNNWSNAFDGSSPQEFRTSALSRPSGSWTNTTPFTLSAWVKLNVQAPNGAVIGLFPTASQTSGNGYVGSYYKSGPKYAWYFHGVGTGEQFASASPLITTGAWDHVVQIYDGTNLKGYVNGVLRMTVAVPNNGLGTGGTVAIHGSSVGRWSVRGKINIDEVAIWDTALTDGGVSVDGTATAGSGVANIYNSGTPSNLTSLSPIGWWLMGDSQTGQSNGGTTPTTITDVGIGSHTKADGTLFGSATYSNQTP